MLPRHRERQSGSQTCRRDTPEYSGPRLSDRSPRGEGAILCTGAFSALREVYRLQALRYSVVALTCDPAKYSK